MLNPGVLVHLKSGRRLMALVEIIDDEAYCVWDDGSRLKGAFFPFEALEPAAHEAESISVRNGLPVLGHSEGQRPAFARCRT